MYKQARCDHANGPCQHFKHSLKMLYVGIVPWCQQVSLSSERTGTQGPGIEPTVLPSDPRKTLNAQIHLGRLLNYLSLTAGGDLEQSSGSKGVFIHPHPNRYSTCLPLQVSLSPIWTSKTVNMLPVELFGLFTLYAMRKDVTTAQPEDKWQPSHWSVS